MKYANNIDVCGFGHGHVQGIAVDKKREFMYISFTTELVKTDMKGNVIGSVKGLLGHLGCIAYNYDNGRVYGTLEYKNDEIGKGIASSTGKTANGNAFYIACFDVEKIERVGMDAEKDNVMTTVFVNEVYNDFFAQGHRYGCAGMDGTTFAPLPGEKDGKMYLYVAYGIYNDVSRNDNDYQIVVRYDISDWDKYEKPLNQEKIHTSGPEKPDSKYFIYTGNTTYGVQNLEYDPATGYLFAAVYRGQKPQFPNYSMFAFDRNEKPVAKNIQPINEVHQTLPLAKVFEYDEKTGIYGSCFPHGSTGMISLGDGYFYMSETYRRDDKFGTLIRLYKYDEKEGFVLG